MKKNRLTFLLQMSALALLVVSIPVKADDAPGATPAAAPAGQAGVPADLQTALAMPTGPDQNKAVSAAARAWGQKDPLAAYAWMMPLPQAQFGMVGGSIVTGAANSADPKAAADALVQLTSPRTNLLVHGFFLAWTAKDAAAAEAWCLQTKTTRDYRYIAIFSAADALARKKGADAAAWTTTLTEGDDRNAAIDGTITIWIRSGLTDLTPWIKQLNPADMKWAALVAARNWKPAGGPLQAWIDQLPLSADDKAAVKPPYPDSFHISAYQPAAGAAPTKP